MRTFIFILLFISGLQNAMAGSFSAFGQNGQLYITILGDSCNGYGGGLKVDPLCDKNRGMENYASMCSAELSVISTTAFCGNLNDTPKVLIIDIESSTIAPEAEVLNLRYAGEEVQVKLK